MLAGPKSALADAVAQTLAGPYDVQFGRELSPGTQAVVVLPETDAGGLADQIDRSTRPVYDLLQASAQARVAQVVYLSTLGMMAAHGAQFQIDEDFAPRPDETAGLPEFLGEFVCREFAREGKPAAAVLRLAAGLDPRDAAQAVRLVLDAAPRLGLWSIFHVAPGAKKAEKQLGFRPRFGGQQP